MKVDTRFAWISGLTGLGLLALGGAMYLRERKALSSSMQGLGRRMPSPEAPMIESYTSNGMKTTLRSHPKMPIEMRIATIQKLIHKSVQDPEMRKLALKITAHCPERDKKCEAKAIYDAIKRNIRYTGDVGTIAHPDGSIEGIDLYQSARRTWEFGGGDCDDHNILGGTLLALNGLTPMLRVVLTRGAEDWEHIYTGFTDLGKFVPIDTTLPGNDKFGVEARYHKKVDFHA